MTEPEPVPEKNEPVVINWEDIKVEVEGLTSGEGGESGADEGLTAEGLEGAKQVGKRFLANLNKALDLQETAEAQRGQKPTGWMSVATPLIKAGITTGVEMFQAGKKAKK